MDGIRENFDKILNLRGHVRIFGEKGKSIQCLYKNKKIIKK